jgi:3-dehydroquinate dehydratase/shikimate dehydrogenase
MICISIAQESRRLALFDMFNAAPQCDLLEIRLDRFGKAPELGEILAKKPRPVIMSCRRPQDGGAWDGTEDDRLAILRQCIISKADYVEIELDIADQIRPFGPTKRVISYTDLRKTPVDIADIYRQAQSKQADVIKLTTLAATPEAAWPLVQILANPPVPTVVVGLGRPGVMLTVLGKKIGAPWAYAALERGMEAYPGQPTVGDLHRVYHYGAIERGSRLIGVTGFGERAFVSTAVLNGLFAQFGLPARCLPLGVGKVGLFRKVSEAVKLAAVVVDENLQERLLEMATEVEPAAAKAHATDLLLHKGGQWLAHNTLVRAIVLALEEALREHHPGDSPLHGRIVALVGVNALSRALAGAIQQHGGSPLVVSHEKAAAHEMAQKLGCRYILFEALYTTLHDVLVVCDHEKHLSPGAGASGVHPGYLRRGMTVMDLTATLTATSLLSEARARNCAVVEPRRLLVDQLMLQGRLLTGKEVSRELIEQVMPGLLDEEEWLAPWAHLTAEEEGEY